MPISFPLMRMKRELVFEPAEVERQLRLCLYLLKCEPVDLGWACLLGVHVSPVGECVFERVLWEVVPA